MKLYKGLIYHAVTKSLPLRERGLKRADKEVEAQKPEVAPPAGAWIETLIAFNRAAGDIVAPPAGAWIETRSAPGHCRKPGVAPPAGAWIETLFDRSIGLCGIVAPPAGAWIET